MKHRDQNYRFTLENSPIRGEWTMLDASYKAVISKHGYPLEIQSLLGQMLTAAVLLSSTIKFSGLLIIQARGSGPLRLMSVECTHDKKIRGYAQWQSGVNNKRFNELLKNATLSISIVPDEGQRYQGIVNLEKNSLAACLEDYFERSEQIKTRIWLAEGDHKTAGLLLQFLPLSQTFTHRDSQIEEDWERLSTIANTLTAEELLSLQPEQLLHRLFHEEDIRLYPPTEVSFHCPCSRERVAASLTTLPRQELEAMIAEAVVIEPQCEFCKTSYRFDSIDLQTLLSDAGCQSPGSPSTQ